MINLKENRPTADILMFSMRSMGYSFESAIADIIDNSISANATDIKIFFPIEPNDCFVGILDNGYGMSQEELFDAMKYGSERKRNKRDDNDLGRFGLGLKAASLSQCRRLTVASKKDGLISAYVWDLDVVKDKKDWFMVECDNYQISKIKKIEYLDNYDSGTLVLWENFDLIEKSSGNVFSQLSEYAETTEKYLSLIFHRYLNSPNRLKIKINNYTLVGLDPFLENHRKTNIRRQIEIPLLDSNGVERKILVQPYVLPFQKDLSREDEIKSGGIENYKSKQGFYIYRNERLIVWGTWFGRKRSEMTKYARIRVDIPNTLDDIWGIDIKKQSAKIPASIKNRLSRAVDDAMDISTKAQKYRGRKEKQNESVEYIWDRIKCRENKFLYKINRDAKVFELVKNEVDDSTWTKIDMILEEIEKNIPYQQIYIDKSQNAVDENEDFERLSDIKNKAKMLVTISMNCGNNDIQSIIDKLFIEEPFCKYPDLKTEIMEDFK